MAGVLITGGTGGLGGAVVERVSSQDHGVGVVYAVPNEWTRLLETLGDRADGVLGLHGDALDADFMTDAVRQTVERFGSLRALIHLIGGYAYGNLADTTLETWQRMLRLNLDSAFVAAQATLPALLESRGSMVFVGAQGALDASPHQSAYNAAKSGVMAFARSLSTELRDSGVRVNAIVPDIIDTPANRRSMPKANVERWLTPAQVADTLAFLVSDRSTAVNGALLTVCRAPGSQ